MEFLDDATPEPECADVARRRLLAWVDSDQLATSPPYPCPYLPDLQAQSRGFLADQLHPDAYHDLMDRGFRRSGDMFYAMACEQCRKCVPIRIDVAAFRSSRSQRRASRRNQDLVVRVGEPEFTPEKFELYQRYQRGQHGKAGDEPSELMQRWLYQRVVDTVEVTYSLGERTLAVSLLDVCARSVSAVYHFFDPAHGERSLGVFSVLAEIEWTRRLGVPHYYLGYWIEGAKTMDYKASYRPHELLRDGIWRPA